MKNNACCCVYSILASIIGAVGIAGLFFAGAITTIAALFYVTLVLGIISLLILVIRRICGRRNQKINLCFIAGMVGSIITSIFALTAIALPTGIVAITLLIGAVAFFLISNVINLISYAVKEEEICK